MSHFKTVRWTKALVVFVLAGSAARGQQTEGDPRTAEGRSFSMSPGGVAQGGDPRDANGRVINDGARRSYERDEERLARVKRWLDENQPALDNVLSSMQDAKRSYDQECKSIVNVYNYLVARDQIFKARMFQCPNGHPPSLCNHTLLKLSFIQSQLAESGLLKSAARDVQARVDAVCAFERRYNEAEAQYQKDLASYNKVKVQYQKDLADFLARRRTSEADLDVYGAGRGAAAGSSSGTLIFDDAVRKDHKQ
jgi:hypothetical protein